MEISRLLQPFIKIYKTLKFSSTHMYTNLLFGGPNYMGPKVIVRYLNYSRIVPVKVLVLIL